MRYPSLRFLCVALVAAGCEAPELGPFDGPFDPANPGNDLPGAPSSISAEVGTDGVTLSWLSTAEATGYVVYRALRGSAEYSTVIVDDTTHVDSPLAPGVAYDYAVCAVDGGGVEGQAAEMVNVVPGPYGIVLAGGAVVTADRQVELAPVGPGGARIVAVGVGRDPESAAAAEPVSIDGSTTVVLSGDDGAKPVYSVLYTDSGAHTTAVADTIRLDQTVEVTNFWWCVRADTSDCDTGIDVASAGSRDVIEFNVVTTETDLEGNVVVQVGAFDEDLVVLRDPDLNGVYWGELDTRFSRIRATDAEVLARVTDGAGNVSAPVRSTRTLTVTD